MTAVLGWLPTAALVAMGVALTAWWVIRWKCAGPARWCPGRRGWATAWVGLARRSACGYDLSGCCPDALGGIRCPECGTESRATAAWWRMAARRPVRLARGWRMERLGVVLVVVGIAAREWDYLRYARWVDDVPTEALVRVERVLGDQTPERVERMVVDRVYGGVGISSRQARILIPKLIDDLRSDQKQWNADRAMGLLESLGPTASPLLEEALGSADRQQRQMAASVLITASPEVWLDPPPALLRVAVEALEDDDLRAYGTMGYRGGNASTAFEFLAWVEVTPELAGALRAGITAGDAQQRLSACGLVAMRGVAELYPRALPVLIDALGDNEVWGDGVFAASTLARAGPGAVPYLEESITSEDRQQRDLAWLIRERIRVGPGVEIRVPSGARRASEATRDPTERDPLDAFPY